MNARFAFSIVMLCVTAGLTGCGSVTSDIAFQAPASGWTGTPAIFGHVQMWYRNGQQKQMLMLVKGSQRNTQSAFSDLPVQYGKDIRYLRRSTAKLCGTQPAQMIVAQSTSRNGRITQLEAAQTDIGDQRYVAFYIRPANMPADPQAESALRSLCPAK